MTKKVDSMRSFTPIILLFSLLLAGCITPQKPEVPAWVETPPAATDAELFGVSVADTPAQAYVSAAGGVAAAVLDTAEPLIKQQYSDADMRRRVASAAKEAMGALDYAATVIKKRVPLDKQTAVLVGIPRHTVSSQLAAVSAKEANATKRAITHSAGAAPLVRLGTLGKAYEARPRLLALAILLNTVDPVADTRPYYTLAKQVEDAYNAIKFGLGITVISDADGIVFVNTLTKALRSQGITPGGKHAGTILISADSQTEHTGGTYFVKTRVRLTTTANGSSVAKREHYFEGSSRHSLADAKKQTAEALGALIKEVGLFHTLGF